MAQRISGVNAEAVLAGYERRPGQLGDELTRPLYEPGAKRETEEVFALDPYTGVQLALRVQLRHERGHARAAGRAVD